MSKNSHHSASTSSPTIIKLWYILLFLEVFLISIYLMRLFPQYAFSVLYSDVNTKNNTLAKSLIMVIIPVYFASVSFYLSIIYRSFKRLGKEYYITGPYRLILYYFIPVFNLFWAFFIIIRLPSRINQYIAKHNLAIQPISAVTTWITAIIMLISKLSVFYTIPKSDLGEALPLIISTIVNLVFMYRISNTIGYIEQDSKQVINISFSS